MMRSASSDVVADFKAMIEMLMSRAIDAASRITGIKLVYIGADGEAETALADDKRDVWAHATEILTGYRHMGRVYTPAGILFRKPKKGETAHVLRPEGHEGPGQELVIPDGGDGAANHVPDWYDSKAGVYVNGQVARFESKTDDVEMQSGDGKKVTVNGTDYSMLKTEDFLSELKAALTVIKTGVTTPAVNGVAPVLAAAAAPIETVITKLGANGYLSTKAKCG